MQGKGPRYSSQPPAVGEEAGSEYNRGFDDGVRDTLKEVISFIARGHSASEVRLLAETRLDHPGPTWQTRAPAPSPLPPRKVPLEALIPSVPQEGRRVAGPPVVPLVPGFSYLFLESSPYQSRRFLPEVLASGLPIVLLTRHPEGLTPDSDRTLILHLVAGETHGGEEILSGIREVEPNPGSILGIIARFQERHGPAFSCYIDNLEFLNTEGDFGTTLKFIHVLNTQIQKGRGYLIVSTDPAGFSPKDIVPLKRDFNQIRQAPD